MSKAFSYLTLITLCAAVILGAAHAKAHVIEVNSLDHIVYVHPTPTAKFALLDLDTDGGILSLFLDYTVSDSSEINNLEAAYPGYELKILSADAQGSLRVDIPLISFSKEVAERQGQMGPYVNAQFELNAEQTRTLKRSREQIAGLVQMTVPASVSYMSETLLEEYRIKPADCSQLEGQTIWGLIQEIGDLQRPTTIKYDETYSKYKRAVLEQCFEVQLGIANNFAQLLNSPVTRQTSPADFVIQSSRSTRKTKSFSLAPRMTFEVQGE